MSSKSDQTPWMSASDYGRSLGGLGVNLLVREIEPALKFSTEVLSASVVYSAPDFAVLRFQNAEWMLHADHTYDAHPLYQQLIGGKHRGIGAELRLHGRDPDQAQHAAQQLGFKVLQESMDKPHGVREVFIHDADGYLWVPDIPIGD